LPRLQGAAGDFAFDQMSENTLNSYSKLVNELKNRFGVIENKKTYRVQFNRRNQKTGETVEIYATELKRIYEKQLHPEVWAIIPAACLYCSNLVSVLPLQIYLSILPTSLSQ
jgi:hypothetical protein